ncbi:polysaccharide deacetylase family protein [Arthrobacter sp. UYEF3]|uniref:polysaccharide deacetylase family protein n=1 Tax=Arthrobacter sp. UYEF3 TaxID=1756365 RepID=UPI00339AD817
MLAALFNSAILAQPASAAGPVIVSLTFDDSHVDQVAAAAYMNSKGLKGTFYVPSGFLNSDPKYYMTTDQAKALQTAGNEIAGHTVTHPDLTLADTGEQQRQICNDRNALIALGLRVTSFAYPFAASNSTIEPIVAACGYNSARGLGDIASKNPDSAVLPLAETIPPGDPFLTKAPDQVDNTWTLQNLKDLTLKAEPAGGWMQYTFHHIGVAGESLSIPTADFNALIDFLATEQAAGRVIVKTVDQVIGGAVKPSAANGPTPPAPITTGNLIRNPGFETAGSVAGSPPACWVPGAYGTNAYTTSTVTTAHSGTAASQLVMSSYTDGDAKMLPPLDTGQCAPTVTPGHRYTMSAWYTSTAQTQFELYYRIGQGAWHYWTSSPFALPSATYTQTSWTSPPVPAGATAMSMALTLSSTGTLVTDDYSLTEALTTPGAFQPITPARLLDTRTSSGPVAPNGTVSFKVAGTPGIPASVSAVAMNLTVTETKANGFVTAYASGATRPNASNLNYGQGQTVPNMVVVPVGADGNVTLFNQSTGTAQLIADVAGYYLVGTPTAAGAFKALAPSRFLDTRTSSGAVAANGTVSFQVGGANGIPSGVSAVAVNVTVTEPKSNGFVTAYASGAARPGTSNLNYAQGQTVPNMVTVPVGADGKVTLFNQSTGTTQLVADVAGYYLAGTASALGTFQPTAPLRFLDTRTSSGPVAGGGTVSVAVAGANAVPATASATILNVTVTEPRASGFITAYDSGSPRPNASNLNYGLGQTVPNMVTVPVGAVDGKVNLYNQSTGTTQLVADVFGYFL